MTADVESAVNPCRRFFELEVEARLIAAAMEMLGMERLSDKPTKNEVPEGLHNESKVTQKLFLRKIASLVVDKYVIHSEQLETFLAKMLSIEEHQVEMAREQGEDGRFACRFPGCNKTFAYNGKRLRDHEAQHNPPVQPLEVASVTVTQQPSQEMSKSEERDDMYNYQCSFLQFAMIIVNFFDAIREGDGKRIVRCWKFALPYLRNDKSQSTKYALEALALMFQVNATLSPRDSHRLVWNRTVSLRPGHNIPLDLLMEFYNRVAKELRRKLGPNATNKKCITRHCNAIGVNKDVLDNFDEECRIIRRSGRHVVRSSKADLERIVEELLSQRAFLWTPGRSYSHFEDIPSSLLDDFDMQGMFSWIGLHKTNIELERRAR